MDTMLANQLNNLPSLAAAKVDPQAQRDAYRKVSENFVGFFMGQMLKSMRETIKPGEIGHGGRGEEIFQGMADETLANEAAKSDAYGLNELVYQSLLRKAGMPLRKEG